MNLLLREFTKSSCYILPRGKAGEGALFSVAACEQTLSGVGARKSPYFALILFASFLGTYDLPNLQVAKGTELMILVLHTVEGPTL